MRNAVILLVLIGLANVALASTANRERQIITRLTAAYNAGNLKAYAAYFAADVAVYNYPKAPMSSGKDALIKATRQAFDAHNPQTHIKNMMVINDKVITFERATYSVGKAHQSADVVKIYQFENGLVRRMTFMN